MSNNKINFNTNQDVPRHRQNEIRDPIVTLYNSISIQNDDQTHKILTQRKYISQTLAADQPNQQSNKRYQDYNKLLKIYDRIPLLFVEQTQAINKIQAQLTQFSANQLLFKSAAPFWTNKPEKKMLKLYLNTILTLTSNKIQITLIQKNSQQYLAIKTPDANNLHLLQADPIATRFINHRHHFLSKLKSKYISQQQQNKLSQLSEQILYLYHEYYKLKNKIISKLQISQSTNNKKQKNSEQDLKLLLRQLRRGKNK